MQPIRRLLRVLEAVSSPDRYLYALADLRSALPEMSDNLLNVLLSRAVGRGDLVRVCRGIYLYPRVEYNPGLVLAHTAARLRAGHLLYLSLESALTHKRYVFPSLTELFAFLQRQTVAGCDANEDESATGQRSAATLE